MILASATSPAPLSLQGDSLASASTPDAATPPVTPSATVRLSEDGRAASAAYQQAENQRVQRTATEQTAGWKEALVSHMPVGTTVVWKTVQGVATGALDWVLPQNEQDAFEKTMIGATSLCLALAIYQNRVDASTTSKLLAGSAATLLGYQVVGHLAGKGLPEGGQQ